MKVMRKRYIRFWTVKIVRGVHPVTATWVVELPGIIIFVGQPHLAEPTSSEEER